MLIKPVEYEKYLKEQIPDYTFTVNFSEKYKEVEEIYRINIEEVDIDFFMLIGRFDFSEEEMKNNFVKVAKNYISNYLEKKEEK